MFKNYRLSLFIFRRDLRLADNTALIRALGQSDRVMPCFIFDPRQIEAHPYQSKPGLQFMLQAIEDLQRHCRETGTALTCFYGSPESVLESIRAQAPIEAIFVNRDYSPFSRRRDESIQQCCERLNIDFVSVGDALLTEPEQVLKADRKPYQVFTAFYHQARQTAVRMPESLPPGRFELAGHGIGNFDFAPLVSPGDQPAIRGGRSKALALLGQLERLNRYEDSRDFPAQNGTSGLSAHLKFGTVSIREVYYAICQQLGPDHPLLRQLYWRDFFTHLGFHFPRVFGHAFHQKYDTIAWENDPSRFQAWAEGRTGFPIVDAGMRELNATGLMHNRVRMIAASFLVKDLHISWRWGERYFAQHLVDYDPCVNNGNWQWAASTGCDAQPYFRIFNPWLQQQKFDPDCRYIYRWIPELSEFSPAVVHQWDKKYAHCAYPRPMLDHKTESEKAKGLFRACQN